jgi:hypothetical protein
VLPVCICRGRGPLVVMTKEEEEDRYDAMRDSFDVRDCMDRKDCVLLSLLRSRHVEARLISSEK